MIEPRMFWVIAAFAFGAVIGSFLNVVIYRLPRKQSFVHGRSHCPRCNAPIRWWQNIPVLSFIFLRGRCYDCRDRISIRYPVVELLTAVMFAGWIYRLGPTVMAAGYIYLSAILICVLFIDWDFQIIPDVLTYPSLAIGLVWAFFAPIGIVQSLLGAVIGGGGLLLIALVGDWVFKKESMGGGDIKLAAVLGAFLGWKLVVLVFFLSALIGAVASLIWMMISAQMRQQRMIPFGPFLAAGAVVAAIWGHDLIGWYLRTFWVI